MSAIIVPKFAQLPIRVRRWARNTKTPDAQLAVMMATLHNQIAQGRAPLRFRAPGNVGTIITSFGAGQRDRWRFAFHSGPFASQIWCRFQMALQSDGAAGGPKNGYGRMRIANGAGATIGDAIYHYGQSNTVPADVPSEWSYGADYVNIAPDTDYFVTFSDFDSARMISADAFEVSLESTTQNGYLDQNFVATGDIYDSHRQALMTSARTLWRRSGIPLGNWSVNDSNAPITTVSAVARNVIDNTSTAVSAATPGYTLELTGKNRKSQTAGLPCALYAYGRYTAGAAGKHGTVIVKDSTGAIVGQINNAWTTGAAAWQSNTITMPALLGKYDLQFSTDSGTFDLYAISLFQYDL